MWGSRNVECYRGNKLHHEEKAERKPRMYQWRLLHVVYSDQLLGAAHHIHLNLKTIQSRLLLGRSVKLSLLYYETCLKVPFWQVNGAIHKLCHSTLFPSLSIGILKETLTKHMCVITIKRQTGFTLDCFVVIL